MLEMEEMDGGFEFFQDNTKKDIVRYLDVFLTGFFSNFCFPVLPETKIAENS